jgi:hypothetical protein
MDSSSLSPIGTRYVQTLFPPNAGVLAVWAPNFSRFLCQPVHALLSGVQGARGRKR